MRPMFLTAALGLALAPVASSAAVAVDRHFYMMTADTEVSGTRDVEERRPTAAIARSLPVAAGSVSLEKRGAALTNLCIGYAMRGEYAEAAPYCDQAVINDAQDVAALVNRGVVRTFAGDRAAGIEDFEKALELDPRVYQARANLAEARENMQLAENPQ